MMFEQCNIVIFSNIVFLKKHRKFSGKIRWKFSEIFRTNFPPHITSGSKGRGILPGHWPWCGATTVTLSETMDLPVTKDNGDRY